MKVIPETRHAHYKFDIYVYILTIYRFVVCFYHVLESSVILFIQNIDESFA